MNKKFESNKLLTRPTLVSDAGLFFQLMNTPKFIKYVGDRKINSIKNPEKYIQNKILPQLNTYGYSNYSSIIKAD